MGGLGFRVGVVSFVMFLISFTLVDMLWRGLLGLHLYSKHMGDVTINPRPLPATLFYLIYPLAVSHFVIWPELLDTELPRAARARIVLMESFLFGASMFGLFGLANHALISNWPWMMVGIDFAWGALLTTACAFFACKVVLSIYREQYAQSLIFQQ
jgi:uncharacterized membrane protein